MSVLLFKRDELGTGHPAPEQIKVGELVINSVTGKIYTKLVNGSIVEFIGQKICFDPTPTISLLYQGSIISNDTIDKFCCAGAILEFEVKQMKLAPTQYVFEMTELTSNSLAQDIQIQTPQYSTYTETVPAKDSQTPEATIEYRQALVPVNLSINNVNNISLFKFTVSLDNKKLIEKIITIKCQEAQL
jgi:predicted transcriptional regulator